MTDHGLKPPAAEVDAAGSESPILSGVVAPVVMPIVVPVVSPVAPVVVAPVIRLDFTVEFGRGTDGAQLLPGLFAAQFADTTVREFVLLEDVLGYVVVPVANRPDH